jgi:hypothetical protein
VKSTGGTEMSNMNDRRPAAGRKQQPNIRRQPVRRKQVKPVAKPAVKAKTEPVKVKTESKPIASAQTQSPAPVKTPRVPFTPTPVATVPAKEQPTTQEVAKEPVGDLTKVLEGPGDASQGNSGKA